ncbi:hypothetical protein CMI37_39060 [Candidatus Pacearchaeota archaeon]|nr:hypothetical protein [Candidatus Pacearchaeota archaeon]|tara:strand:- start:4505 stop:4867 length:363 start_codon:yes stop_codon:yes gene_type:complete
MGYSTWFNGSFEFSRTLTPNEIVMLNELNDSEEWREGKNNMPDGWCDWETNPEGTELRHNGAEKFYHYVEWLEWLIRNFFKPKGVVLNGEIEWDGEDRSDIGIIIIKDNVVEAKRGHIEY